MVNALIVEPKNIDELSDARLERTYPWLKRAQVLVCDEKLSESARLEHFLKDNNIQTQSYIISDSPSLSTPKKGDHYYYVIDMEVQHLRALEIANDNRLPCVEIDLAALPTDKKALRGATIEQAIAERMKEEAVELRF